MGIRLMNKRKDYPGAAGWAVLAILGTFLLFFLAVTGHMPENEFNRLARLNDRRIMVFNDKCHARAGLVLEQEGTRQDILADGKPSEPMPTRFYACFVNGQLVDSAPVWSTK